MFGCRRALIARAAFGWVVPAFQRDACVWMHIVWRPLMTKQAGSAAHLTHANPNHGAGPVVVKIRTCPWRGAVGFVSHSRMTTMTRTNSSLFAWRTSSLPCAMYVSSKRLCKSFVMKFLVRSNYSPVFLGIKLAVTTGSGQQNATRLTCAAECRRRSQLPVSTTQRVRSVG